MNDAYNTITYQQYKIITLDDMKNRSIENIIELYRDGYRLGNNDISTLQVTCPAECSPTSDIIFSWLFGFAVGTIAGLAIGVLATRKTK